MQITSPKRFIMMTCLFLVACTPNLTVTPTQSTTNIPTLTAKTLPTGTPLSVDDPAKVLTSENIMLPGGLITALAIDPLTPTTLYAAASGGSIFKSMDGAKNWNLLYTGLPMEDIDLLQVDPFTSANLYAVTENSVLYQSKDGGQSWSKNNLKDPVSKLMSDPVKPGVLYSMTNYTSYYSKSEDGGQSWQIVNLGLPDNEFVVDLVIDPSKPNVSYIATHDIYNNNESRLYKSMDDGKHWRVIQKGIPKAVIYDLMIDPYMHTTLYVTLEMQNTDPSAPPQAGNKALYKSTNGGESWFNLGLPASDLLRTLLFTPSALYAVIDTTTNQPKSDLYQSNDNSQTWSKLKTPSNFFFRPNVLAIDPTHPDIFYLAADDGVFKSEDSGQNWGAANSGLNAAQIDKLVFDPFMPSTIYSIYDSGIFKSADDGKTWHDTNLNADATGLVFDPVTPDTLYAATKEKGVFKSTDGGGSWRAINQGLSNLHIYGDDGERGVLIVDPSDHATIYAGAYAGSYDYVDIEGGLFKSTNAGQSWEAISGGTNRPNVMVIDLANTNIWYVGGYERILKSMDAGSNWTVTSFEVTGIATALTMNVKAIYAGTDMEGIFKSNNGGQTWQSVSYGLPNEQITIQDGTGGEKQKIIYSPIAVLTLDPVHPNTLYAGIGGWHHGGGLYRSTNGGETWQDVAEAGFPPNTRITDLQFDPANPTHLYVATYGRGIWRIYFEP